MLSAKLVGIKGNIAPIQPEGYLHNWYNYTNRVNMAAIGWTGKPAVARDAIMKALQAEGVPVGIWQRFILPDMTVFKAKNAYGGGYPWSIPGANEGVDYSLDKFPNALAYSRKHISVVQTLRAPNGLDIAEQVRKGIVKVFSNLDKIDPDRITAILEERKLKK